MATVDIPGLRKAAILLVSLDRESAAQVLGLMDRDMVEAVTLEIARLSDVTPVERTGVLEEFYALGVVRTSVDRGGIEHAKELLEQSVGREKARQMIEGMKPSVRAAPFTFLQKVPPHQLSALIGEEHPQTIALILTHLRPARASELLTGLPAAKQVEVVRRIANMEHANPEIVQEVERALASRLAASVGQKFGPAGGVGAVAEILSAADRTTERVILEDMAHEDPDLADEIRRQMFAFEDLLKINSRGLRSLLRAVETSRWALALKGASRKLRKKIFAHMPPREAALLKEEMDYVGPVRVSEVEAAQQQIVAVLQRLEDAGEIVMSDGGAGEHAIR